jgi:glycosyltransferase involved in cell wall biosynthesis
VGLCLLPSIWPETFSYVTQELMSLGVPLVCFDLGAPAECVRHIAVATTEAALLDAALELHASL